MRTKMMSLLIAATICTAPAIVSAPAQAKSTTMCVKAYNVRQAVIKKHGKRAPGRNICRYGVLHSDNSVTKPTIEQKARYLAALRRMNWDNPYIYPGKPRVPPAGTATPRASLPYCTWGPESGGNYRAVSPDGKYGGKYQMDMQTWASVGGSGSPAAASPAEQDKRAAILYSQRGGQPWANC